MQAAAFIAAATNAPGRGERYLIGGTNATNLQMLQAATLHCFRVARASRNVLSPRDHR